MRKEEWGQVCPSKMQENGKIIDKVKKLLALTVSPYADEAEAAMLKAQELLLRHGLTISDIQSEKPAKEVVDERVDVGQKRNDWWEKSLAKIIGDNFRCEHYFIKKRPGIYFIGLKDDVAVAKEVFSYAAIVIRHLSNEYVKANKTPYQNGRRLKNDYIIGFLDGLHDKFAEQVNSKCLALMLIKDDAVVEAAKNKNIKKARRSQIYTTGDADAIASGYIDGKNFDHERKMIE